jgi:TolA-binding protein
MRAPWVPDCNTDCNTLLCQLTLALAPLAAFPAAGAGAPPWVGAMSAQLQGLSQHMMQLQGQMVQLQGQMVQLQGQVAQLQGLPGQVADLQQSIQHLRNRTSLDVTLAREANQRALDESAALTPVPHLDTGAAPPPGFPPTRGGECAAVGAAAHFIIWPAQPAAARRAPALTEHPPTLRRLQSCRGCWLLRSPRSSPFTAPRSMGPRWHA